MEEHEGEGGFIAGNPRFGSHRNFLEQKYSLGMDSTSGHPEIAAGWREGVNGLFSSSPSFPLFSLSLSLGRSGPGHTPVLRNSRIRETSC